MIRGGSMRSLTKQENDSLNNGKCPYCNCEEFYQWPEGGGSVNIQCTNDSCSARFCFHGGIFTSQFIEESKYPKLIEEQKILLEKEKQYDTALLDFLAPQPIKATLFEKLRRVVGL